MVVTKISRLALVTAHLRRDSVNRARRDWSPRCQHLTSHCLSLGGGSLSVSGHWSSTIHKSWQFVPKRKCRLGCATQRCRAFLIGRLPVADELCQVRITTSAHGE